MFKAEFFDHEGNLAHNCTVKSIEELWEVADGRKCQLVDTGVMDHSEAMIIIKDWGEVHGLLGTLEILTAMKRYRRTDELSRHQDHAFDIVMGGLDKLFNGDEA